jgi:hypothetical protein
MLTALSGNTLLAATIVRSLAGWLIWPVGYLVGVSEARLA